MDAEVLERSEIQTVLDPQQIATPAQPPTTRDYLRKRVGRVALRWACVGHPKID